ncbi:unnamed protein product [Staurois parvus]|uniref:Uncharacterized protein n=1 Tax=Staurois parvus TaxID=386267 RepID=A0ABN9GGC1_9NEOB|nr:unnamed protein product [Staurois parvus]
MRVISSLMKLGRFSLSANFRVKIFLMGIWDYLEQSWEEKDMELTQTHPDQSAATLCLTKKTCHMI